MSRSSSDTTPTSHMELTRQRESSGPRLVQCTIGVDEDRRQAGP